MDPSTEPVVGSPLGPGDPSELGEYTMLRRLGQGGMGTVYLARRWGGPLVAIKIIRPEFAELDEFRVQFRSETDHARRVARFCTAEVLDADPDGEQPYIVTEFVEGATLSHVVTTQGPLSGANLERLAVGVAAALTAIHGAGIVHRDLKPGNVMLSPFGPRVIDFGIARASDVASGLTDFRVGTPGFMAPEQVLGEKPTGAVDIFAWGAVVAFAGSGRYPFGSSTDGQMYRIMQEPPDLRGLERYDFLLPIVERAMSKNPPDRPTATELLFSLLGNTTAPGGQQEAVTQALSGWVPPRQDAATPAGPTRQVPTLPPPSRTGADESGGKPPSPPADPERPPAPPPATDRSNALTELPYGPTTPERPPTGPPQRPGGTPPGPDAHRTPGRRRRSTLIGAALAGAVVIAAAVVGGVELGGGSSSHVTAPPTSPVTTSASAGSSTGTGTGKAQLLTIPRSAPLPDDTLVATRVDGSEHFLITMRSDGTDVRQVGTTSTKDLPAISPDRRTIAFYVYANHSLWLMAADGTGTRPMFIGEAAAELKPFSGDRTAWSPDGTSVCIVASGPDGDGLYVVQLATGNIRKLPSQARVGEPSWSPKGDLIVYWASPTGSGGPLYTIAADGRSAPKQLTNAVDDSPAWAPEAAHITYRQQGGPASGMDIWSMRADGTHQTDFTPGVAGSHNDMDPSYAPDSQHIVFCSDRTGEYLLYIMTPGSLGQEVQVIPDQTAAAINPSWSNTPLL